MGRFFILRQEVYYCFSKAGRVKGGPTKEFIDTVIGMVKGYGFDAAIKPNSFGASVVVDRHI